MESIHEVNFVSANSSISHQLRYTNTVSWIGGNVAVHMSYTKTIILFFSVSINSDIIFTSVLKIIVNYYCVQSIICATMTCYMDVVIGS